MGIFDKLLQKRKDKLIKHAASQMEPGETVKAMAICEPAKGAVGRLLVGYRSSSGRKQVGLMATDRNLYVFPLHPLKQEVFDCALKQTIATSDLRYEKPNILVGEYAFVTAAAEKRAEEVVEALRQPATLA